VSTKIKIVFTYVANAEIYLRIMVRFSRFGFSKCSQYPHFDWHWQLNTENRVDWQRIIVI